jgi:hypothetical protein
MIGLSLMTIISRFLKWTHTDTMATPCLILAAHTVHVMRLVVLDRYITITSIKYPCCLIKLRNSLIFFVTIMIIGAGSNWESKKAGIGSRHFYWEGTKGDWMKFEFMLDKCDVSVFFILHKILLLSLYWLLNFLAFHFYVHEYCSLII